MCHVTTPGPFMVDLSAGWDFLRTKFDVSNYIHYEDMKSGAKCTNWGSLGQLGVTQGHPQCHNSIERIRLPIRL